MTTTSARRLHTLIRRKAPLIYPLLKQYPMLEAYFAEAWQWIKRQRALALNDLADMTPAERRLAKQCATEISLSLLQEELEEILEHDEQLNSLQESSA